MYNVKCTLYKYKLQCILSIIDILNLAIIEGQSVKNIFQITDNFVNNINPNSLKILKQCKLENSINKLLS